MTKEPEVPALVLGKVEFEKLNEIPRYSWLDQSPVPDFELNHVTISDYNRYGVLAFSGVTGLLTNPDFQKKLADQRRKMTIQIYFED